MKKAIAFGKWLSKNGYYPLDGIKNGWRHRYFSIAHSTEGLYKKFVEYRKAKMKH